MIPISLLVTLEMVHFFQGYFMPDAHSRKSDGFSQRDYALRNAQVTICENAKGVITILYKNKPLAYTTYKKLSRQAEAVDTKNINQVIQSPKPPAQDHPWRSYGQHLNGHPIQELLPHGAD